MRALPHWAWFATTGLALSIAASGCSPNPVPTDVEGRLSPVAAAEAPEESAFTVSYAMPASYDVLSTKTVRVTMDYTGDEPVTALALRMVLPSDWQYAGIAGALRPAIEPPAAARGELTFVWIQTPDFPATFECLLDTPESGEAAPLSVQAVYRGLGEEERSPIATLALRAGG